MRTMFSKILMAKADDKGGASGGKPAKGGADDGDDEPDNDLEARINRTAHAAIAAKTKKLDEKMAALDAQIEKMTALTAALEAKIKEEPKQEEAPAGKGGKPDDAAAKAAEARIKAAEKKAEDVAKQLAEWQAKAERAEQNTRDNNTRAALLEHFTKGGVPPAFARLAVKDVFDRIGYEDDPEHGKGKGRAYWKGDDDEALDLGAGVAAYLKTDEGKVLIPARGTGGSGKGAPSGAPIGSRDRDGKVAPLSDGDLMNLVLAPPNG